MNKIATLSLALLFIPLFIANNAIADQWIKCADEHQYCKFSGKKKVRYGAKSRWHALTAHNGIACNNKNFGDPAPGTYKHCYYLKNTNYHWQTCAREGQYCHFKGRKKVRYGANGHYAYRTLEDGAYCNNYVFGDPAPGIRKHCTITRSDHHKK